MAIPRRKFLIGGMGSFGATLLRQMSVASTALARLQDSIRNIDSAEDEALIWYSTRYLTAEMPIARLNSWITPTTNFFVRNNLLLPRVSLDSWRLRVTGEVSRPLELTFDEFRRLSVSSLTNTLECAGNGRAFFRPAIAGVPWRRGAVGNALFSGPRLRDLLEKAGLKTSGHHVAFKGLDIVPPGAHEFVRSIPVSKALEPSTLVASHMNGAALTREHGFPARALVPGWIGSCSIKWLCEIRVLQNEFNGFYMSSAYRLPGASFSRRSSSNSRSRSNKRADHGRAEPITSLVVKSIIAHPQDGATVSLQGPEVLTVSGAAWAGENAIERVEVSTDGGHSWRNANLDPEQAKYAWRLWKYTWRPARGGAYLLQSRATDRNGNTQPQETRWNPSGYLWNGIDQIRVTVAA
jgi:sulfite oxidase